MKRVIVVSDSHGMEDRLRQVLQQAFSLGPVDVLVFLGDGLSEWERVSQEFLYGRPSLRLYAVKGNNDFGWDAPLTQVIAVGKAKLLLCHGHTFHVKNGLYHLEFEAADQVCDHCCCYRRHKKRKFDFKEDLPFCRSVQ